MTEPSLSATRNTPLVVVKMAQDRFDWSGLGAVAGACRKRATAGRAVPAAMTRSALSTASPSVDLHLGRVEWLAIKEPFGEDPVMAEDGDSAKNIGCTGAGLSHHVRWQAVVSARR